MELFFSPRERAERLIAGGRIVLAATSLAALWRDPTEPEKYAGIAYALLAAYLLYALTIALLVWRWPAARERQALPTHCFDLAFFAAFMYFTSGPASPFIAYFVFSLVCATLRWQWRGTLWTAVAALAVYSALGYYFAAVVGDSSFETNRFVIRGVYMAVVAFLLGQLGRHEQRTRREMLALAGWSMRPATHVEEVLEHALADAAAVHQAPRAAIAWRQAGRPAHIALWSSSGVARLPPADAESDWIADELAAASVLGPLTSSERSELLLREQGNLRRVRGAALPSPLRHRLGDEGFVLSAPWRSELSSGRLYVAGVDEATADDLLLVEIAAALVGARLDTQFLLERRREAAAAAERVRLSRDLHDGVLQSLTAIGLRVAAARRLLETDRAGAELGLAELQRLLAVEQRDLRFLIRDLEPPEGATEPDLGARLAELARRVEEEWQLEVDLVADELEDDLDEAVERDLYFLVREALVNAVRHGEARRVRIELRRPAATRTRLVIEDDGHGFPFAGRFDLATLAAQKMGPRSLRERVADRGGELVLDTSADGARLEIEIPV